MKGDCVSLDLILWQVIIFLSLLVTGLVSHLLMTLAITFWLLWSFVELEFKSQLFYRQLGTIILITTIVLAL